MIQGLHFRLAAARAALSHSTWTVGRSDASPQELDAAKHAVPRHEKKVKELGAAIDRAEADIKDLEAMILRMNQESWGSRLRSACIHKLEEASDCLRRELGDHPSN